MIYLIKFQYDTKIIFCVFLFLCIIDQVYRAELNILVQFSSKFLSLDNSDDDLNKILNSALKI